MKEKIEVMKLFSNNVAGFTKAFVLYMDFNILDHPEVEKELLGIADKFDCILEIEDNVVSFYPNDGDNEMLEKLALHIETLINQG